MSYIINNVLGFSQKVCVIILKEIQWNSLKKYFLVPRKPTFKYLGVFEQQICPFGQPGVEIKVFTKL